MITQALGRGTGQWGGAVALARERWPLALLALLVALQLARLPQRLDYALPADSGGASLRVPRVGHSGPAGLPHGLPLAGPLTPWLCNAPDEPACERPLLGCTYHDPLYRRHSGVDLPADFGTPMYATLSGQVNWAGERDLSGNLVAIENGNLVAYFAHLKEVRVSAGDVVARRDLLGLVGFTGNSSAAHVHSGLLVYPDRAAMVGEWVDPATTFGANEATRVPCG